MPIVKKQDGWWWGGRGPFTTKSKALQVAKAAYASGFKEENEKDIVFSLDYDNTYDVNPEFWNQFIELCNAAKYKVLCITQEDASLPNEYDKVIGSIGRVIGEKNCYFTAGQAKIDYCKDNNINIDIWIDNNPKRIMKDKKD